MPPTSTCNNLPTCKRIASNLLPPGRPVFFLHCFLCYLAVTSKSTFPLVQTICCSSPQAINTAHPSLLASIPTMAKMLILVVLAFLSFLGTFCPSITVAASLVPAFDGAIDSGLLSPAQLSAVQKSPSQDGNDTENLKELAAIGCCYSYLGFFLTDWYEDWNRDKMNAACKIYCATQELSDGYGVRFSLSRRPIALVVVQQANTFCPVSCANQHHPDF